MEDFLPQSLNIIVPILPVLSKLLAGLTYTSQDIIGPLQNKKGVMMILLANFVPVLGLITFTIKVFDHLVGWFSDARGLIGFVTAQQDNPAATVVATLSFENRAPSLWSSTFRSSAGSSCSRLPDGTGKDSKNKSPNPHQLWKINKPPAKRTS